MQRGAAHAQALLMQGCTGAATLLSASAPPALLPCLAMGVSRASSNVQAPVHQQGHSTSQLTWGKAVALSGACSTLNSAALLPLPHSWDVQTSTMLMN